MGNHQLPLLPPIRQQMKRTKMVPNNQLSNVSKWKQCEPNSASVSLYFSFAMHCFFKTFQDFLYSMFFKTALLQCTPSAYNCFSCLIVTKSSPNVNATFSSKSIIFPHRILHTFHICTKHNNRKYTNPLLLKQLLTLLQPLHLYSNSTNHHHRHFVIPQFRLC